MALHAKAKSEPDFRFYALYDKISREDILAHAYAQCRSNKGAPGVDRQDFEAVEAHGVERWLGELALTLREETYRPDPIRRVYIPKARRPDSIRFAARRPAARRAPDAICARIAFMPQGLGKNLYADLTVRENIEFFGRLFGQSPSERDERIAELLHSTGLAPFSDRLARKLSGGMGHVTS